MKFKALTLATAALSLAMFGTSCKKNNNQTATFGAPKADLVSQVQSVGDHYTPVSDNSMARANWDWGVTARDAKGALEGVVLGAELTANPIVAGLVGLGFGLVESYAGIAATNDPGTSTTMPDADALRNVGNDQDFAGELHNQYLHDMLLKDHLIEIPEYLTFFSTNIANSSLPTAYTQQANILSHFNLPTQSEVEAYFADLKSDTWVDQCLKDLDIENRMGSESFSILDEYFKTIMKLGTENEVASYSAEVENIVAASALPQITRTQLLVVMSVTKFSAAHNLAN